MGSWLHQAKETLESFAGIHLWTTRSFPFVHARRRFLTVRMDVNNKCNLRCTMCYFALEEVRRLPPVEMSDCLIERLRREVWPRTQALWLSCAAEPLIAPKLQSVLVQAKRSGVPETILVTNGVALSEEKAAWMIEAPLDVLIVSLDGASPAVYERLRPPARFEKTLANIERLQAMKRWRGAPRPSLQVAAVMMRENLEEWADIVRLAADLGADRAVLNPRIYYDEMGEQDGLAKHPNEVNAALERARAVAADRRIALAAPEPFHLPATGQARAPDEAARRWRHCWDPWTQIVVYPDGEAAPCTQLRNRGRFGNLEQRSFRGVFYGPEYRALREELRCGRPEAACHACSCGADLNDPAAFSSRAIFP